MGLKKGSEKQLQMDTKETSFKKESDKKVFKKEGSSDPLDLQKKGRKNANNKVSKGLHMYKEELENDDYGIESTSKLTEKTFKTTKSATKKLKNAYSNRKENKLKKADEEYFYEITKKLDSEQKRKINKVHKDIGKSYKNTSKKPNKIDTKVKKTPKNKNDQSNKSNFIKKVIRQPKRAGNALKKKGVSSFKQSLESDDDGIKVGTEGSKLIKDSTKSIANIKRARTKRRSEKKLQTHNTKLESSNKLRKTGTVPELRKEQKVLQKKKIMRRNIDKYRTKKSLPVPSLTKSISSNVKDGSIAIKSAVKAMYKKVSGAKLMATFGAIGLNLVPLMATFGVALGITVMVMMMGGGGGGEEEIERANDIEGFDSDVEQWRDLVTEVAQEKDMTDYIDLALAIIQVETGGSESRDIMQSSESAGYDKDHIKNERKSVEQGFSHLGRAIEILERYNSDYVDDLKLIAQTYNFGIGFASYVGSKEHEGYDIDISETFSKEVVAVSGGNKTGETYEYKNSISEKYSKPYLYKNGGNFFYGELIAQHVNVTDGNHENGDLFPPVQPMYVTSHYGYRPPDVTNGIGTTLHKGIDLSCQGGVTPINAISDGVVIKSKYVGGLGNTVVIKHGESNYSTYGHMSFLTAKFGQEVNAGDKLGVCGSTGNSTGPHLHLEISPEPHKGQVDPYPYIKHLIGG